MKLIYENIGHILTFQEGFVNELVIENKRLFYEMVNSLMLQADGQKGKFVLSISNKPVEFGKYADVTVQFAPFQLNRKHLLTKLYATLEQEALQAENYMKTRDILSNLETYIHTLAAPLPFEISCQKLSVNAIIRALSPEIEAENQNSLEKIFAYMELVRELDRERLFIMVNMRTYFSDEEITYFVESACLHDFKLLLLESYSFPILKNTKRYTVDEDLCEF